MDTEDLAQQQALQKEFNDLVLNISREVSKNYLQDTNKNIKKVNSEIIGNLEKYSSLLIEVSKNHPESLEDVRKKHVLEIDNRLNNINAAIAKNLEAHTISLNKTNSVHAEKLEKVSKKHLIEINKNIKNLNEDIPVALNSQSLLLQSIEKALHQSYNDILDVVKKESNNLITTNERLLIDELEKIKQKIEIKLNINNSEINKLKSKIYQLHNETNSVLEAKTSILIRTVLYTTIIIVICLGLPIALLTYSIIVG